MRVAKRWPEGRARASMPVESRTTKALAVTPEVWRRVNQLRQGDDGADDVLRRLLGLQARERG
jgi:hypothetical protein